MALLALAIAGRDALGECSSQHTLRLWHVPVKMALVVYCHGGDQRFCNFHTVVINIFFFIVNIKILVMKDIFDGSQMRYYLPLFVDFDFILVLMIYCTY